MTIKIINAKELYDLRHQILRPHRPYEDIVYDTDLQKETFHVGAYESDRLVSIASFNQDQLPDMNGTKHFRLRAMATLPAYRRLGLGREVVAFALERLKTKDIDVLWCKGRTTVQAYYESLGFEPFGEVFDYPTIGPHILMVMKL